VADRESYLFGIDLDGTLLNPASVVADRTKSAVHAVLKAGHKVAFATGRNYTEARQIFDTMEHQDLAVLVSGAIVVDTRVQQTVFRSAMDPTLASQLCAAIERLGFAAVAFQDRAYTGVDYVVSTNRPLHRSLRSWLELSGQLLANDPDLAGIDHAHTLRVSTVLDYADAARLKQAIEDEFGDRAYVHGILVVSDGVEIIEMFDRHVNKWLGLTQVADHHGVPHDRIIAIGDDMNDLAMIRHASLGVAMGNAREDVKVIADRVIGSNADDGLAVFLEEWLETQGG
jgi:5-amino-6-(5-phospho-D-ribitylamino)uracil phosphatase